ncbi:uncharacterized protein LY89DRAFT_678348 [Mollisia scopiformis]|uniref:DUF6536 domain-containing protein n=1 Tax=Mollisia scopiformis TaxID=149040 RepID=A0A132B404_MOLSC|nr:uncharacterized protein LY89DRAFT_678348 [Mollisia scopiformis]KUJ06759.1 hypothetical protein LY89DRAFT_678348 [Mollisia scopiformis]
MNGVWSSVKNALPWPRTRNNDQQYPLLNVVAYEDVESSRRSQGIRRKPLSPSYAPLSTATSREGLLPTSPDQSTFQNPALRKGKSKRPQWRRALLAATTLAAVVLAMNVTWLIVVMTRYNVKFGLANLYEGSCNTTTKINLFLHILINVLSTALMGASNYAMQCLNSPTREEVDKAHQRGKWLSVGLTNMKNLAYIPRRRVVLFVVLFLSTWPLHFVWNSIIFSTRQTNMYSMLIITPDFLSSDAFDNNTQNIQQSGGYIDFYGFDFSNFDGTRENMTYNERWETSFENGKYTGGGVGGEFNSSTFLPFASDLYQASKNSTMKRLEAADCMREYSATFLSGQRNLFIVVKSPVSFPPNQTLDNGSMLAVLDSRNWNMDLTTDGGLHWNPSAWMCSNIHDPAAILLVEGQKNDQGIFEQSGSLDLTCDTSKALSNMNQYNNWTIASQNQNQTYEVDYCLSETVPEMCQVQFSIVLMIIVIVCNVCKFVCMVWTQWAFTDPPLVVLGDAIASFLSNRDVTSEGICLTVGPNAELVEPGGGTEIQRAKKRNWTGKPKMWSDSCRFCLKPNLESRDGADKFRRVLTAIGFGIGMLYKGSTDLGLESFSSLSFGSISPSALLFLYGDTEDPTSQSGWLLLRMVMIANSPQIYFSLLYFLYNRSYTAMLSMAEWTRFALDRKSLRVSNPVGIQRSTYWLQLPYLYSIPLLVGSGLVHWILSECLFLVRISFFDRTGQPTFPTGVTEMFEPSSNTLTVPGYSPKAILAAIIVTAVMFAVLVWNEFRAYKSAIPLVVNSSFAISAACHPPHEDEDAAFKKVMWGAISHPEGALPGHCCITSFEVEEPRVGEHYE